MFEKYYTPEQLQQLEERRSELGEDKIKAVEQEWREIYAKLADLRGRGVDPGAPEAQAVGDRAGELIQMFTGGDPAIARSLQRMYENEDPQRLTRGMGSPEDMGTWSRSGRRSRGSAVGYPQPRPACLERHGQLADGAPPLGRRVVPVVAGRHARRRPQVLVQGQKPLRVGHQALHPSQVEPGVALARHLVDHEGQRRADGPQQLGGLGHQRRRRRVGVGDQHDLVGCGLGGAGGRPCRPVPQSSTSTPTIVCSREITRVGLLVELRHARRVGRRGQHHQAVDGAPQMAIRAVTERSGCSSTSPRSSTNTWWSGVSVRPATRSRGWCRRPRCGRAAGAREQDGRGGLPHPALRRDDGDRGAAREPRRGDQAVEARLVVALAPARLPALARRALLGLGEHLAVVPHRGSGDSVIGGSGS